MNLGPRALAALAMLGAMVIYGTNFAISRHAVLNGFTVLDMTALRFGVAAVVLFPLFLKAGGFKNCAGIGWGRGLILTLSSGLPMTLLMMQGLSLSPAAHGASIGPGTVTVIGALGGWMIFGVNPGRRGLMGIAVVVGGLALIALAATTSGARNVLLGDLCFFGVGLLWGGYPLLLQLWKVDALRATAVLAVLSALVFWPWYLFNGAERLLALPLAEVAFHGFNQGILNMIIGLWMWGHAVKLVGAAESGKYPPLIPVIGTISAIPLLGEWPGAVQWVGIGLIVAGLAVTSRRAA